MVAHGPEAERIALEAPVQITRIKPGGWIIILLLLAGIIFGVRACGHFAAGRPAAEAGSSSGADTPEAAAGGAAGLTPQQAGSGDVLISTTGTKQKWLQTEIDKFNAQSQGGKVSLNITESRQAMQAILNGKLQPVLWSPSSPVWTSRLTEVWPQAHGGASIGDTGDSQSYRVLFKSPLVFLTTKRRAAFLKPILTGPGPWAAVTQLGAGQRKSPGGAAFRFAYADPLNASSGMLTMSLIVTEYTRTHGGADDPSAAVSGPKFAAYLSQLDRAYVHDAATSGSSALEKAFAAEPGRRDFITAYENAALAAVDRDPNLAIIYPIPTANADQGVLLLSAPWVSDGQKTTARAFLDFLSRPEARDDGVQQYFRPAQGDPRLLARRLGPAARAQFQVSPATIDLQPYDALNEAAAQWHTQMK